MNKKLLMSLAIFSSTFVASELANLNEAEASTKKATTYKLTGNAATYTNAANAAAGVKSAKKTYAAGNYYVYKTASNGMINISTQPGKPGAWINPNGQVKAQVPTQKEKTTNTATKPASTQSTKTTNTVQQTKTQKDSLVGKLYPVAHDVKGYASATDAESRKNARTTYKKGNYYIYKTKGYMFNLSRTQGKAGAWVNTTDLPSGLGSAPAETSQTTNKTEVKKSAAPVAKQTTTTPKPTTTTAKPVENKTTKQETYVLTTDVKTYTNAANAAAGKNSKSTYGKGTYYVFRSVNGMLNISRTAGKVGAWINPTENKVATKQETAKKTEAAKAPTKSQTPAKKVEKQKSGVRTDYGNYSKIIYLDAGHGGSDPGAMYYGLKEKDLNLSIYKKLTSQLQKQGYTVMARRTGDTNATLPQISEGANKSNADLFISIHFNASSNKNVKGIETYWYQDYAEYPSKLNQDNHTNPDRLRRSQILANGIHSNMVKNTGAVDRGVRRDTYSVLRETAIPAVLLELGYMSNKDESNWISKSSYQDSLVDGIVKGINNYYAKA